MEYFGVLFHIILFFKVFSFWWGVGGKKKPLSRPIYGRLVIFASTTTPIIRQLPLIGIIGYWGLRGLRNLWPASITSFLKVASLSPSSFATTNFPLIASTWGSTSIAIPSGMLSPAGDVMESPLTSNQNESSEHSTVVSYHRSIALRWYGSTASIQSPALTQLITG